MYKKLCLFTILTLAIATPLLMSCKRGGQGNVIDQLSKLESLDGDVNFSAESLKGKPVVLNFWATWCGPCREEMPLLEKTWKKHKDKGVMFVGVDVTDDRKNALEFLKSVGVTYPNLFDPDGIVSNSSGIPALPTTMFIDRTGKIAHTFYGPFINEKGEKALINGIAEITK